MLSQEDISLIEKRLSGEPTENERQTFDEKYNNDVEFKREANYRSSVLAGIEAVRKDELKNELKSIFNKPSDLASEPSKGERGKSKKGSKVRYWIAAAAVISLFIVYLGITISGQEPTSQELFAEYFRPADNVITKRNSGLEYALVKGMNFYDLRQYDSAVFYLKNTKQNYTTSLYLGISQLAEGQFIESIETFKIVEKESSDKTIVEYAEWYRALAYLANNEIEQAKKILANFQNRPDSDYYKDATNLLEAL
ncbi:MAG: tetratricopeptide repeat protein [Bacteroidota bacterium]